MHYTRYSITREKSEKCCKFLFPDRLATSVYIRKVQTKCTPELISTLISNRSIKENQCFNSYSGNVLHLLKLYNNDYETWNCNVGALRYTQPLDITDLKYSKNLLTCAILVCVLKINLIFKFISMDQGGTSIRQSEE